MTSDGFNKEQRGGRAMTWLSTKRMRHGLGWLVVLLTVALVWPGGPAQGADSPVAAAAKADDLAGVRKLITARADVNLPGNDGSTALLWAAYNANADMVRALLTAGAKVDTANRYGVTPLLQASRTGDTPIMDLLLKAGANPALAHPEGETPLMAASRTGRVDAVRLLLARGVNVNAVDNFQAQSALMWASTEGHTEVVKALLEAGANPNLRANVTAIAQREHADHPSGGMTALMFAARNGHVDVVKALAASGADLNVRNGDGNEQNKLLGATAMIIAIVNDRFDMAATLLELGADPNDGSLYFAVDMHDATTDMRARDGSLLRWNHPNKLNALDLVKLLLDKGADPNKPFVGQLHSTSMCCGESVNASPFYRAAIASDVEVLKLMIAKGADVEWAPGEVKTAGRGGRGFNGNMYKQPIFVAAVGGRGAALAAGPGFTRLGPPPFREASNRKPADAVKVLLEAGADPNAWESTLGGTPLHAAVQNRWDLDIIRHLVAAGAKLDYSNREGLTPLQMAERPEPAGRGGMPMGDPDAPKDTRPTREQIAALLRELSGLPPAAASAQADPAPASTPN
jgi:ankyrin repeat protein